jgi:NAD(P)-dependent dehydrogenase (short-subunit alcohol dehydrogenase family)
MNRMNGKVALITGGTSGIGLATARLFSDHGAKVVISGIDERAVSDGLGQLPSSVTGVVGRVELLADLDVVLREVKNRHGVLNTLVLCAGVMKVVPLDKVTESDFDSTFGVNVKAAVFLVQKAAPLMPTGSSVILIGSGTAGMGRVGRTLYAASKAAVRSLARSLAAELAHLGIRVNVVSPGPIMTPLNMVAGRTAPEQAELLGRMVPLGRVGMPADVANAILFLATDESSFVLGADIAVDGGWAQLHEVPHSITSSSQAAAHDRQ